MLAHSGQHSGRKGSYTPETLQAILAPLSGEGYGESDMTEVLAVRIFGSLERDPTPAELEANPELSGTTITASVDDRFTVPAANWFDSIESHARDMIVGTTPEQLTLEIQRVGPLVESTA